VGFLTDGVPVPAPSIAPRPRLPLPAACVLGGAGKFAGMAPRPLDRLDATLGDAIEAAVRARHRRRLRRLGWGRVADGGDAAHHRWAAGDPPPRAGNELEVLIDGAQALPQIAQAIAGARTSVHLTGWHVAPAFALVRGERPVVLGELLAETAARGVDVRVLVWAGAPLPVFHPTRAEVRRDVETLVRGTAIRCEPDPREHPFHCHHEKTVVVDGEVAFVGGIDLTDFGGDRFDTSDHPAHRALGWHDVAVRLRGPAVADVAAHFRVRWAQVTGERLPAAPAPPPVEDGATVQVVRTVAEDMYDALPHGDFRILESYLGALRGARELVYLESQFLWAPEIVGVLADKLRDPPSERLRIVVLLPRRAKNGQDDTRGQLGVLAEVDDGRGRFLACTVRSLSGERDDPLYVHAKVGIVDDRWMTIGSANLNAHSLLNDTELNVVTDDAALVRETRARLWAEHLERPVEEVAAADPIDLVDAAWRPTAHDQLHRLDAGEPPTHRLIALPGVSRRSARLLGPLSGILEDG
jgi:phosphatidylserine/phosphatidylglycerophosphate/cardiolipin synthase-like enzyme